MKCAPKFIALGAVAVSLGLSVLATTATAQSSWIKFCNTGKGVMVYRKIALGRTSASRSETVLKAGKCGPNETGFPTAYAFFARDRDNVEYNIVYQNPAIRVEAPKNLKIERACFNPHNKSREVVSRTFANEYWLGDTCRPGQKMARVTFVVLSIRGNGRMTYNLARPDVLPASVWFDGGAQESLTRQSTAPAGGFEPAEVLLRPLSRPEIQKTKLRTLDNIPFADLPRTMTLSPESDGDIDVTIDGRSYGLADLVDFGRKSIAWDVKNAATRDMDFYHIFNRPFLLRTDDGGHAVFYADMRRKTLIVGAVGAGVLESHVEEYLDKNPFLTEFFASSYFTDRGLGIRYTGTPKQFVNEARGGWTGVHVTQFADSKVE